MRYRPIFAGMIICLMLMSSTPAQADVWDEDQIGLFTSWPIEMMGRGDTTFGSGATRIDAIEDISDFRLQAESVTVEYGWEKGAKVRSDPSVIEPITDQGEDEITIKGANVQWEKFQDDPFFVVISDAPDMNLTFRTGYGMAVSQTKDATIAQVGSSPYGVGAGDSPNLGYWPLMDGALVKGSGTGVVQVTGSFTLFAHDVVIKAEGETGEWSDWTGYWESDPGSSVTEYELRVTTIHVENGTFVSSLENSVDLYGTEFASRIDGSVTSRDVTGRLLNGDEFLLFDRDPLEMEGKGSIRFEAQGSNEGQSAETRVMPIGDFVVHGASGVEPVPAGPRDAASVLSAFLPLGALAMAVATLATVGMVGLGVVPAPTAGSRERFYGVWMRSGDRAKDQEDWPRASKCYERATRVKREDPLAWYELAYCVLEGGDAAAADAIANRAMKFPGSDHSDLLDLRATAAWARNDWEAFQEHLGELTRLSKGMGRLLVAELAIDLNRLDDSLRQELIGEDAEGPLDGYV